MAHTLLLEPQKFTKLYAVTDLNLSTKAGREWKADLPDGVTIIKEQDYEHALLMAEAVKNHPQAKHLFKKFTAEKPVYWERDGIKRKAKPDLVSTIKGLRFCVDFKSTESANPEAIRRSIAKYGYHRQAAWYLEGMEATEQACEEFLFIFVKKTPPYIVTMCKLDEAAIAKGREECARGVEKLKECQETGLYPCYTRGILTLSLPSWAA